MNKVMLIGNLTRDPDMRHGNMAVARFSLAINRYKEGTDYPNIVVFGKQAENCERYLSKGSKVAIEGHIQTGSYLKDGKNVYTTDIVADRVEFLGKQAISDGLHGDRQQVSTRTTKVDEKSNSDLSEAYGERTDVHDDRFMPLSDDELPFNPRL